MNNNRSSLGRISSRGFIDKAQNWQCMFRSPMIRPISVMKLLHYPPLSCRLPLLVKDPILKIKNS